MFHKRKNVQKTKKQAERSNAKAWGQEHAWTTREPMWLERRGSRASQRGPRSHNAVIPVTASCHWDPINQGAEWKTDHQDEVILPPNRRNQTDKPAPRKMPPHHSPQSTKSKMEASPTPQGYAPLLQPRVSSRTWGLDKGMGRGPHKIPDSFMFESFLHIYIYLCD